MGEEKLRREAEKEEELGKQDAKKKFPVSALVRFRNAEYLWQKAGDFAKVEEVQREIENFKKEFWE